MLLATLKNRVSFRIHLTLTQLCLSVSFAPSIKSGHLNDFALSGTSTEILSTLGAFRYQTLESSSATDNQRGIPNLQGHSNMALVLLWLQFFCCFGVSFFQNAVCFTKDVAIVHPFMHMLIWCYSKAHHRMPRRIFIYMAARTGAAPRPQRRPRSLSATPHATKPSQPVSSGEEQEGKLKQRWILFVG